MNECQVLSPNMKDFAQILEKEAYEKKIPLHGLFELTARCNFNCNMCYVHLKEEQIAKIGRELTNEEWLDIARQAKEAGMLYLTLTGGEVFARPGFKELYIELSKMGFLIKILSNGYLIDESTLEWLKEYPPYMIRFTLYGTSNETYEAVCGIKDGFDRVSHAIDLILEAKIPFHMVATVVKENIYDINNMYVFAKRKGIFLAHTTDVVKAVRGATADVDMHRITEFIIDERKVADNYQKMYNSILDICGNYRKKFCITWNGNMVLCTFMEKPSASVIKSDFLSAWNQLLQKLAVLKEPVECLNCKYEGFCKKCPGILSAECGNTEHVTEEFCMKAKRDYNLFNQKENKDEKKIYKSRNNKNRN